MFVHRGYDVNFNFPTEVQQFNNAYLREGSEQAATFKQDFKTALTAINSNIPLSTDRQIQGNYRMGSNDIERFTEIASRSFSQIPLQESEAKELVGLMDDCKLKLRQSQLINRGSIEEKIIEAESEIVAHEIFDDNNAKIGNINITETIKEEQKTFIQNKKWFDKIDIPSVAILTIGLTIGGVLGLSSLGAGALLTLLLGPLIASVAIPMMVVGGLLAAVSGLVFGILTNSATRAGDLIVQTNKRIVNLVKLREVAKEDGFQEFIDSKNLGSITVLDDSKLTAIMGHLPEWERTKNLK